MASLLLLPSALNPTLFMGTSARPTHPSTHPYWASDRMWHREGTAKVTLKKMEFSILPQSGLLTTLGRVRMTKGPFERHK